MKHAFVEAKTKAKISADEILRKLKEKAKLAKDEKPDFFTNDQYYNYPYPRPKSTGFNLLVRLLRYIQCCWKHQVNPGFLENFDQSKMGWAEQLQKKGILEAYEVYHNFWTKHNYPYLLLPQWEYQPNKFAKKIDYGRINYFSEDAHSD